MTADISFQLLRSDIDFEYPSSTDQGQGFANLLTSLRTSFNQLATQNGDTVPYQLTASPCIAHKGMMPQTKISFHQAAVAAGSANYANLAVSQMNSALTYWNLMVDRLDLLFPSLIS